MKGRYQFLITILIIIGGFWGLVLWVNFDLIITGEREEKAEYRYEGLTVQEREDLYYEKNPSHKIIEDISSGEEIKQREVLKQKEKVVQTTKQLPKQLPTSCYGVNSMELDIYPTGKQCFAALNKGVEYWCSNQKSCVNQFYLKLADLCEDPVLSSVEVCLMYNLKDMYPKLVD